MMEGTGVGAGDGMGVGASRQSRLSSNSPYSSAVLPEIDSHRSSNVS